jgi:hypothetical protein
VTARDDVVSHCRTLLAQGVAIEAVIQAMRAAGFSKIDSIRALVDLGHADLREAKRVVHQSDTWRDVRDRDDKFHRNLTK